VDPPQPMQQLTTLMVAPTTCLHGRPARRAEGGEALPVTDVMAMGSAERGSSGEIGPEREATARWHALWTRSHCERLVHDQLTTRGFLSFLPEVDVWASRGTSSRRLPRPMFPGYLFIRHALDKQSYVEVIKTRGLVRVLGQQWDRLDVVPDAEIGAIQRVLAARVPVLPYPFLKEGQRVRITRGPLADVEGILVQMKPSKGYVVLSIDLLSRSVAVEVDCTHVVSA
jgi:transcription antitermination factor NusG